MCNAQCSIVALCVPTIPLQGVVLLKSSSPFDVNVIGSFNFTVCRSLNPLTDEGSNCDPGNAKTQ